MNARAALDAARIHYTGAASANVPPSALWDAAESVLQEAFRAPALRGQALIGEGRRLQAITLADAHALVSLRGWVDRLEGAGNDAELQAQWRLSAASTASDVWSALERATDFGEHVARIDAAAAAPKMAPSGVSSIVTPSGMASVPTPPALPPRPQPTPVAPRGSRRVRWVVIALAFVTVGALAVVRQQTDRAKASDYDEALKAFERGDYALAERTFNNYFNSHNNDARPLIYLGRIARIHGSLTGARLHLRKAITLDPKNAIAMRELASTLLASGDLELARPFYVRAVELDPHDRLALGFLACTLHRLRRDDEADRFAERAGAGEWTPCLQTALPALPPPPSRRTR